MNARFTPANDSVAAVPIIIGRRVMHDETRKMGEIVGIDRPGYASVWFDGADVPVPVINSALVVIEEAA